MTRIQCAKDFECEVCHIKGMLQILGNYARVRHYAGLNPISKKLGLSVISRVFSMHKALRKWIDQMTLT